MARWRSPGWMLPILSRVVSTRSTYFSNPRALEHIAHLFSMTGAVPNSAWLGGCVVCDEADFIKTGLDLTTEDLAKAKWPLSRPPYLLETSLPGVFAVGDIRGGI